MEDSLWKHEYEIMKDRHEKLHAQFLKFTTDIKNLCDAYDQGVELPDEKEMSPLAKRVLDIMSGMSAKQKNKETDIIAKAVVDHIKEWLPLVPSPAVTYDDLYVEVYKVVLKANNREAYSLLKRAMDLLQEIPKV